tara:strand:+ start:2436 stop:2687 length:252 start_codon:yes stop_codon:yes gene_type:complete
MKRLILLITLISFFCASAYAAPPKKKQRSRFYDFNDQIIDGEIRKPTALYTDARQRAKFERLLSLKKSFLGKLFETSKHKIFK